MKHLKVTCLFVAILLSASIGFSAEDMHWPQFREAVRNCNLSEVATLLNDGFDINYVDDNGWSALHWANFNSQLEVRPFVETIDLLIKNGIDVNKTDKRGRTALLLLIRPGNDQIIPPPLAAIKLLVAAGTDLDLKDENGNSVISVGTDSEFDQVREYFIQTTK